MGGTRTLRAVLLATALAGAACSASTSGEATTTTATPTTGTAASAAPVRGVTDDAITLGVALIDVDAVRDRFGVDLGNLPDDVVGALVDAVNADGGINGRRIEVVQRPFMPVGNEESEAACRELIEDHQVYAVLGMFLGDNALCVTETYSTPYLALFGLDDQRHARSNAPFVTMEGAVGPLARSSVERFVDEGVLDGARVAVYHESAESPEMVEEYVLDPLEAAGVEVVSTGQLPSSGDAVQAATDVDRILQRFEADGADTLLAVSGAAVILPGLERTAWAPQLLFTNGQFTSGDTLDGYGLTDPSELEGALAATISIPSEALEDDELMLDCLATINGQTGADYTVDDIFSPEQRPGARDIGLVVGVCQLWHLTVEVLTAAGDDLSRDGLLAALDQLDDFAVPGVPHASLGTDRWGANETVHLWRFDPATATFAFADDG